MRIVALVTDAFGSYGGIAKYNRDLLTALAGDERVSDLIVLPRSITTDYGALPKKICHATNAAASKWSYALSATRQLATSRDIGLVICGHINLLPIASAIAFVRRAPQVLCIHGIEAWTNRRSAVVNRLAARVDHVLSVSRLTLDRFRQWTALPADRCTILPNSVSLDAFRPGTKPDDLIRRYELTGKRVVMTVGRLAAQEQYKGFDEMIESLPALLREEPSLVYLIVGDGDDRDRLAQKARGLGVREQVVFTGLVDEREKAAHYRLADAFAMPSRGEGFGIVFLEAMATGIPVVASKIDGGREALRDGEFGILVDPDDRPALIAAILEALRRPKGVPDGLDYFSRDNFDSRVRAALGEITRRRESAGRGGAAIAEERRFDIRR